MGRGIPGLGCSGCAHVHVPVSWKCGIGKEGIIKPPVRRSGIVNSHEVTWAWWAFPCSLSGAWWVSLSLSFQQQVLLTDEAYQNPISQLMDPAGNPREDILLSAHRREHVPNPLPEPAGEVSPACGAAALWGTVNLYELEQPLLEVTTPGPARELIPDLLFNKHPTLLLFRCLEFGPVVPKAFGSQTLCGGRLSPGAV